jgi:hypothetical protein
MHNLRELADSAHAAFEKHGTMPPPEEDALAWVAAKENGYVNCLLTLLAEGCVDSIAIQNNRPLPVLAEMKNGDPELERWAACLSFDYKSLSSDTIIHLLLKTGGADMWNKRTGSFKAVVVREPAPPDVVTIVMHRLGWLSKGVRLSVCRNAV